MEQVPPGPGFNEFEYTPQDVLKATVRLPFDKESTFEEKCEALMVFPFLLLVWFIGRNVPDGPNDPRMDLWDSEGRRRRWWRRNLLKEKK